MKIHLITYATPNFLQSARDLRHSAARYGIETTVFGPRTRIVKSFADDHPEIMRAKRGAGYWLWKPFIILETLKSLPDGDVLMYCDAGAELVADPQPLAELATVCTILLFHQARHPGDEGAHLLRKWTKRDALVLMDVDREEFWNANSLVAGYQLYRRTPASLRFSPTPPKPRS